MGVCSAAPQQSDEFSLSSHKGSRHAAKDQLNNHTIEYLTDVEGNWDYFCYFVNKSEILSWEDDVQGPFGMGKLLLDPKGILVFGGDAPDKGPGDIRFVRILLDLQSRHPERVFIILGNRDLNKLRFYAELELGAEPFDIPWDPNAKPLQEWLEQSQLQDTQVNRLRWMLHFAGCQRTTFKTRRQELAMLSSTHTATDEDVLDSFRRAVDPNGKDPWMLRLLQVGKLAAVVGDTLFVHGGFHDAALEQVPGKGRIVGTLQDWVEQLNAWKDDQLAEYVRQPSWYVDKQGQRRRGADDLILYGTPGFPGNATVVYYNPFQNGNPQLLSETVEAYLVENRITRLLSGHQPHGQSPTVVRHPQTDILAVTCDTSYSNPAADKVFNEANNRGLVVSVVRLKGPVLEIDGVLADGTKHGCKIHSDSRECKMPDALVGRQQIDGSWIKTVLEEDGRQHVQSVFGNGPPRFDLITHTFPYEKARLNLGNKFRNVSVRLGDPLKDIMPEHLAPRLEHSNVGRNLAAYRTEAEVAEKAALKRMQTVLTVNSSLRYSETEFLKAKTYICSWLGVIDQTTSPETRTLVVKNINELLLRGKRVIFVSNNSQLSRKSFAKEVVRAGINMTQAEATKHVLNTAFTCAWFLRQRGKQKPFVICSETGILEELKNFGVNDYVATITDDGKEKPEYLQKATSEAIQNCVKEHSDVDCVVMGWDFHLTVLKVAVAAAYIGWNDVNKDASSSRAASPASQQGDAASKSQPLMWVKCSSDSAGILGVTPPDFLPQRAFEERSIMTLGNGLMAEMLAFESTGTAFDVGKPSELMLEALRRPVAEDGYGVDLTSAVVIGDELETDIAMAQKGGMKSLLVLSGRVTCDILHGKAAGETIPTWVLESLAQIL